MMHDDKQKHITLTIVLFCCAEYGISIFERIPNIYTVSQKKHPTILLPVTSQNVDRFSKFFQLQSEW